MLWRLQVAQFQTGRCLYAGHAYLAQHKPREASAVFGRARERAAAAIERWRECEHPDAAALAELEAVDVQVEVGPLCMCALRVLGRLCCSVGGNVAHRARALRAVCKSVTTPRTCTLNKESATQKVKQHCHCGKKLANDASNHAGLAVRCGGGVCGRRKARCRGCTGRRGRS